MSAAPLDYAIVGGGIIGLATGLSILERRPGSTLVILDKEPALAAHQSGRNSGVIHTGLYYRPGSVKASTCIDGAKRLIEFCRAHHLPVSLCGKVIVASDESQLPALEALYRRGMANGVEGLSLIGPERLREIEPHARGLKALHVPGAAIVDYRAVVEAMALMIRQAGGMIQTSARVERMARRERRWALETAAVPAGRQSGHLEARWLITCGGLHEDRLARSAGERCDLQMVPFRGEYYEVAPERCSLVKGLIYPVPDPRLPFLGVHFTRTITGGVRAGPNAVLALKREGYRKRDVDLRDTLELLRFRGFWRLARRYGLIGVGELCRSLCKAAFVGALQRLVPEIRSRDLIPGLSGVRAQALGADGALLDDVEIVRGESAIHVLNAPSPAATASLAIGRRIAQMAVELAVPTGRQAPSA